MPDASRSLKTRQGTSKSSLCLDDSLGYLVRRTHRAFLRALERRLAGHDISISMWFFLRLLWEGDGSTQAQISHELGLTPPTTVSALDNLARRGLIRRERNAADRRKINVFLTKKGRSLKSELAPFAQEVNAVALNSLSKEQTSVLRGLLRKVNDSLNADTPA